MKEIDFSKPIENFVDSDFRVELLYTSKLKDDLWPYLILFESEYSVASEWVDKYGRISVIGDDGSGFESEIHIRNVEEEVKFDPRKPVKFAKDGERSNPIFVGELDNNKRYKYIFKYTADGEEWSCAFTKNGFNSHNNDGKNEKSTCDLINYEPEEKPKFNPRGRVKFAKVGGYSDPVFDDETGNNKYPYIFKCRWNGVEMELTFTENGYYRYQNELSEKTCEDLINY